METASTEPQDVTTGLRFPEGPIAERDGSVVVVEVGGGRLTRVAADGTKTTIAEPGGGPNGAAVGPDGAYYVCNNGGFCWSEVSGLMLPLDLETGANAPAEFAGGWIERIDRGTGEVTVLYRECDGRRFCGPNDIVFDETGGFWFTDFGKTWETKVDRGGLYYARPDGSSVRRMAYGLHGPNGVGLSPAGDRVYVAETYTGRVLAWDLTGPGELRDDGMGGQARVLVATAAHFDSLAVEADGTIAVAAINHGVCRVAPDGSTHEFLTMGDPMVTNVCFGGADLRTAYITWSGMGRLVSMPWPGAGSKLAFDA